jgi:hypothetical protein
MPNGGRVPASTPLARRHEVLVQVGRDGCPRLAAAPRLDDSPHDFPGKRPRSAQAHPLGALDGEDGLGPLAD